MSSLLYGELGRQPPDPVSSVRLWHYLDRVRDDRELMKLEGAEAISQLQELADPR